MGTVVADTLGTSYIDRNLAFDAAQRVRLGKETLLYTSQGQCRLVGRKGILTPGMESVAPAVV